MRFFIQYLLWSLSFISILFFYFLNSSLGQSHLGFLIEDFLSKKTYNEIKVHSLNLEHYPSVVMDLTINHEAKVFLTGEVNNYSVDMDYHLFGDSFSFNSIKLEEKVDLTGHLKGPFSALKVQGEGEVFDGNVHYSFTKIPKKIIDMNLSMQHVKSQKVLKFLNKPLVIQGKANVTSFVKIFSKYEKRGKAKIYMAEASLPTLAKNISFSLNTELEFDDIAYKYNGKVNSKIGTLTIKNGEYHQTKQIAQANYRFHLNDLNDVKEFLKKRYYGSLDTEGRVEYDGTFKVEGITKKFGGILSYLYKNENVDFTLKNLSLSALLEQFSYPVLLTAKVYGTANYNLKDKIVLMNTKLKEARFKETKMTHMIQSTLGINMLRDVYDESSFSAGYQNHILSSILKIDSGVEHLFLTETKMNAKSNKIDSKFEMKMQGQELAGKLYGSLKDPQVSLDMSRLIKYQMNRQIGSFFGMTNGENVKKKLKSRSKEFEDKLDNLEINDVTQKAKSLMNGFF